jgi:hypothetical protein
MWLEAEEGKPTIYHTISCLVEWRQSEMLISCPAAQNRPALEHEDFVDGLLDL